jgi:hypothetical protein
VIRLKQSSKIKTRNVEIESIEVENRKGNEIIVVTDHTGQQYTNYADRHEGVLEKEDGIVGGQWVISYYVKDGFVNFAGLKDKLVEGELADGKIKSDSEKRVEHITRDSARHDASRIVAAKIEAGLICSQGFQSADEVNDNEVDDEIKKEMAQWTAYFKHHGKTGEFP